MQPAGGGEEELDGSREGVESSSALDSFVAGCCPVVGCEDMPFSSDGVTSSHVAPSSAA